MTVDADKIIAVDSDESVVCVHTAEFIFRCKPRGIYICVQDIWDQVGKWQRGKSDTPAVELEGFYQQDRQP